MHDYDPSWDYRVIRRPAERAIGHAEARVRTGLLPRLGTTEMTLFFTRRGELKQDRCAVYISGTSTAPVIGLDLAAHRAAASAGGHDLVTRLTLSLAHELGHALLESHGVLQGHDEDELEDFAHDFTFAARAHVRGLLAYHGISGPT